MCRATSVPITLITLVRLLPALSGFLALRCTSFELSGRYTYGSLALLSTHSPDATSVPIDTKSFPKPTPEWMVEYLAKIGGAAGGKKGYERATISEECPKCKVWRDYLGATLHYGTALICYEVDGSRLVSTVNQLISTWLFCYPRICFSAAPTALGQNPTMEFYTLQLRSADEGEAGPASGAR